MPSPDVYIDETGTSPRQIAMVSTGIAAFVGALPQGPVNQPATCRSVFEFERLFGAGDAAFPTGLQVRQFFINGGFEARVCRTAPGAAIADVAASAALVEGFDVLCAPDLAALDAPAHGAAVGALLTLAAQRRAFLVLDPPADAHSVAAILDWQRDQMAPLGTAANHAAVYFPRVLVALPQGGTVTLGPCGTIAGIYARTDRDRGVWKAPIDTLSGVTGFDLAIGTGEQELLNPEGINALRSFPGKGLLVWGARTLLAPASTAPSDRYVSVRRLALMIERSLASGLQWAAFEPNGEPLWARLRGAAEDLLRTVWRQGALQGAKPELAFLCRCGRDTMTQAEIDQGLVQLMVGYAAVRPAEFEFFRLTLRSAGGG